MEICTLRELFELQLEASELDRAIYDVGANGISRVTGPFDWAAVELRAFVGMALNLEYNAVGVVLFTSSIDASLFEGTVVRTTRQVVQIPVGQGYCGRIVNALCEPVDGDGSLPETRRVSVHEPFATGITAIDDLQERITSTVHGSITSIQAVYVPADDMTDPAPGYWQVHDRH